nr:hypothetical protein BaRGS_011575 [Batillaria attramentaria]
MRVVVLHDNPEWTVLRWLEQHNVAVVNGLAALELENSKAWQYMIAQQYGLKVPRSLFTTLPTVHQIEKEFGKDTPFLVKPDRGGRGASVRMYQNVDDFRYDTSGLVSTTGLYVLQEYIPADDGIYRMEFVGDEYLYTSLAKPKTSCSFDPNMCPCDLPSSRFTILEDFHHPILQDCAHFLRQVGLDVAAFEVIFDSSGEGHVIDVNTVTGYNMAAEKKAGVEGGVKALAKYVASRAVSAKKNFETDY